MNPDSVKSAFFALLKAGLWNNFPVPQGISLTEDEWLRLYSFSREQTVEGIIYDGILRLSAECFPPKSLMLKWTALVTTIEDRNKQMNDLIEKLGGFFSINNLDLYLLKGQGLARCYEQPSHRVCGDIDWYFYTRETFKKANRLIAGKGFKMHKSIDLDVSYAWKGIPVEHHSRLIDIHNPFVSKWLKKIVQDEEKNKLWMSFGSCNIALPSPLLSHLVVNSHILKHSLSFGIGLRQLCDSARICYTYCDKIDGKELEKIYRRLGIYRWIQMLNRLLVESLGMPEACLPFPPDNRDAAEWMLDEIVESGNFGFADQRFGKNECDPWEKRSHSFRHILHRFRLFVRYVPSEACWFPVVQLYSRIRGCLGKWNIPN
ncbi:MAG: nucleotidyltransferase family protein [Dysgonamonadaceae bacterium]|jgi:hypothetical protein|nr:nucleotidyltransferase family protein [Dysgonamonadaceae bacterium]